MKTLRKIFGTFLICISFTAYAQPQMSEENIAYKILRADGDIDTLYTMLNNIYDIKLSVG